MTTSNSVLKKNMGLREFYKIFAALTAATAIMFTVLFLRGGVAPTGTGVQAQHPQAPVFSHYVYGGFADGALKRPMYAVYGNNRIYVSDTDNNRVQIFSEAGDPVAMFGSRGSDDGQFFFPYGIAVGPEGNVYVADLHRNNIQVFTPDGDFLHYFGEETGADEYLNSPAMMYLDRQGRLLVANINNNSIAVFNLEEETFLQTVCIEGDVVAPNGITVDDGGYIYVVDSAGERVVVYEPEGKRPVRVFNGSPDGRGQSSMINPRGIAVRNNVVYVVSNLTHTIMGFDRNGTELFTQGTKGDQQNQFMHPNGLFVDGRGRMLVTDTVNNRVAVYR